MIKALLSSPFLVSVVFCFFIFSLLSTISYKSIKKSHLKVSSKVFASFLKRDLVMVGVISILISLFFYLVLKVVSEYVLIYGSVWS